MAAAPAAPQASRAPTREEHDLLEAHNLARAEAGAPPLAWSDRLARDAAGWAAHLAASGRYDHANLEQRQGQGENLWRGPRGHWDAWTKVGFFVAEKALFRPGQFPEVSASGRWSDVAHYTQVIWPQTREVGCAIATTPAEEVLVCRYWPAGNIWGYPIDPGAPQVARR
ncbi:CAP domain-containing protein [Erythrobacter sp. NE805]|uniref:CAP domain-containing protein n=1 Tax=Erythrobacter sp. NE805 TaxID=3389875 RepID=UPI00396B2BC5